MRTKVKDNDRKSMVDRKLGVEEGKAGLGVLRSVWRGEKRSEEAGHALPSALKNSREQDNRP